MKTYTFTYFNGNDFDSFYTAKEFTCTAHRLSQALSCFADFFNSLSGFRDFSSCYRLGANRSIEFRYFKSRYFELFDIVRPNSYKDFQ